ncbi:response regulator [Corallococcus sp. AB004]|uniref:Response regulator n=1 Tax=Corallococcus coralloides (strain ATCC 25202 / DSM 2259 / NBRC 100086 / M2) TaxID=1144275 RepID=H8N2B3_CORCM|nr:MULTISPECIES: response regulator [Corallococcus]RKI42685.1 response regulator [Corallococcus sp. AB004]AFE08067.1 response regulator [Corallococcus coralloides DSM 2259]MBN8465209.1 response regulator [Corallococcus exiguus]NPC71338.1 response regulator [Corallococcus exiguus]NPD25770.1 response regulator [Corallococcus exiguus]
MTAPTVLISDDEPLVVSALAREAKRSGLVCVSDTTSEHVMELARKHRPAVIILDINQHQDGRDLLAQLKKDPVTRDCKVIMLSGVEDQFTRHVCFELGADDYEVKPCDPTFMTRIARMAAAAVRPPASPEAA